MEKACLDAVPPEVHNCFHSQPRAGVRLDFAPDSKEFLSSPREADLRFIAKLLEPLPGTEWRCGFSPWLQIHHTL